MSQIADSPELAAGGPATRRERWGWYAYDWANSAFPTTVVTVFLGPYLTTVTKAAADASGFVHPLGIPVAAGSFFAYVVSFSVFLQIFLLPILGGIADYSRRQKEMLALFAYLGSVATILLFFLQGDNYLYGGACFLLANLSFGASVVFYNTFLSDIATPDQRDAVSSRGWAVGYLGGGLLLAFNVLLFSRPQMLGLSTGEAVRVSLASAGLWWALFTTIPLATLRNRRAGRGVPPGQNYVTAGFRQLRSTLTSARSYPHTLLFLGGYLLYNDGIQAVISLSTQFGQEELGLSIATLTTVILVVQFVAFFGALGFGYLASRMGTKRAIIASLVIWSLTLFYAYFFLYTEGDFFVLAVVIGIVLGGSQALSRSLYSQMIPAGKEAEYFSLYEVGERGTSWLGPLVFGLALQFTGSYRLAILALLVFFVSGMAILSRVDVRRAAREAGNEAPARV